MKYKYLITDFHTNIHHEQMNQLEEWYEQAKEMLDFWPIAYYPYYIFIPWIRFKKIGKRLMNL